MSNVWDPSFTIRDVMPATMRNTGRHASGELPSEVQASAKRAGIFIGIGLVVAFAGGAVYGMVLRGRR